MKPSDYIFERTGDLIATGVLVGLGVIALVVKGADAANNWVKRRELERL